MKPVISSAVLLFTLAGSTLSQAQTPAGRSVLPVPPDEFQGTLAPLESDSTPVYPTPMRAPQGAPNILLVMTDDVGFASVSTSLPGKSYASGLTA